MKVVAISLDPKVLDSNSATSYRNRLYGEITDGYSVVVHDKKDSILELSEKVTVYGVGGAIRAIRLARVALLLRKLVKEGKCDVITSSDPYYFSLVAYVIARIYHVGFEAHILGIEKLNPIRKALARFFVKRAGSIRVNSTRLRDRVASELSVAWKDIAFVPIYVPTHELGFKQAALGTAQRERQDTIETLFNKHYQSTFNFLFVGRLVQVKNIPMQLRAIGLLKEKYPHVRLHIVGEGPDAQSLKECASSLGVEEYVIFHGRSEGPELGTYYRMCDVFLLTSFSEGWPMVIFEAMTSGIPIIMTDVGCAGEMIKNNENGMVVPVDDAQALSSAMEHMMMNPTLRKHLASQASLHIKNYWTKDQILAGYKQSWQKALENKL